MLLSTQTTLLVLLAGFSSAAVLPQDAPRRHGLVARNTPASPAPTQTHSAQSQGPVQPAAVTPSVSLPVACDYTYCDGSSSWCFYWGGVTSYDPNHGPVPGETRTNLGPCGAAATTAPAATR